jgi:hypothetical protein
MTTILSFPVLPSTNNSFLSREGNMAFATAAENLNPDSPGVNLLVSREEAY